MINNKPQYQTLSGMKKKQMYSNVSAFLCELGIILVVIGMQLGTIIRNLIPSLELVDVFMLLSALLILCAFSTKSIDSFPYKLAFVCLLFYQISMLVLSVIYSYNTTRYNISCTAYHLYIPILAVCLISSHTCQINTTRLLRMMFYITGFIAVVLITYTIPKNGSISDISGRLWLEEGGDPIALPRALIVYFIVQLLYKSANLFELGLKVLFSSCAAINLLAFNTRAVYIGLILVLIIGSVKKGKIATRTRNEIITVFAATFFVIFLVFILYFTNDFFGSKIDSIIENTQRGILSYFGSNEMGSDMSTSYRYEMRQTIFSDISKEFSIPNLLFGFAEYMEYYVDIPILQSIYDTGLFFSAIYFYFTIFIPAKYLFFYKGKLTEYQLFVLLFSFQYLLDQFYCGIPYTYYMWTPGLLVWVAFANVDKTGKEKPKPTRYVCKYVKTHVPR